MKYQVNIAYIVRSLLILSPTLLAAAAFTIGYTMPTGPGHVYHLASALALGVAYFALWQVHGVTHRGFVHVPQILAFTVMLTLGGAYLAYGVGYVPVHPKSETVAFLSFARPAALTLVALALVYSRGYVRAHHPGLFVAPSKA